MVSLSLCMIVKDEESVLERCLKSVKDHVDEIVIADTGSLDKTVEIARRFTDKVFPFAWQEDFAAARNFSFSKASGDYILWLDADDVITEENGEKLEALKRLLDSSPADTVICPYDTAVDQNGGVISSCNRERIVRREGKWRWHGCVHECIPSFGRVIVSNFRVTHKRSEKERGSRNLDIYRKNIARGYPLSARDKFYYGRELYYNRLFLEAEAVLTEMIQSPDGWSVNKIEACRILALCRTQRGERSKALEAYFKGFLYGAPRAGALCGIGQLFKEEERFKEAVFWYQAAFGCESHVGDGDFEETYDRSLYPALGLVYCFYRLGDRAEAARWHRICEEISPEHPSVVYNAPFFKEEEKI
ncbi:MAG: glycosyltransferase family 2 protein [Clostridia bacterium]|nr:glycosyltransferase family 2 protein [Clostridia bacterium]